MPETKDIVGRPAVHFEDPIKLAEEPKLTKDQKLKALDNWTRDADALDVAADEGMAPPPAEEPIREKIEEAQKVVAEDAVPSAEKPAKVIERTE